MISSTEYTIGVFGCTGRGKTTFCNFLFKENRFKINDPDESQYCGWERVCSITNEAQHGVLEDPIAGAELHVIDMPGLLATENMTGEGHADRVKDSEKLLKEFAKALIYVKDGIDVLFVALKVPARMSAEEKFLLEFLDGLRLWPYCVLLFTHGSAVGEKTKDSHEAFCKYSKTDDFKRKCPVLAKMVERADKRFVIVESVEFAGDPHYHRSKLDEIYAAIDTVKQDAGSPINHPFLKLARNAFEMQQMLNIEEGNNPAQQEGDHRDHDESIEEYRGKQKAEKQARQGYQDRDEKIQRLEAELQHKHAEAERDRQRTQQLVDSLESHIISKRPNADHNGPVQLLVNYLKRLDDDPDKFVDMYLQMEMMVEEQRRVISQNDAQQVPYTEFEHGIQCNEDVEGQPPKRRRRKCSIL